ncbi:MAG TPA: alpha/beta hydrolase [Solimonas sp.]|nr:alpha/beta hydrolase [Solimonas sp.]
MNGLHRVAGASMLAFGCAVQAHAAGLSCEVGSYRLTDGVVLDVGPADQGRLRWRREDGVTGTLTPHDDGRWTSTLGWTGKPDGHSVSFDCQRAGLRFDAVTGQRIALLQTDTRFQGSGVTLAGRLTLPPGNARVPIVVLVHGAEHDSAIEFNSLQRRFAAAGIGTFVYDKRGTGASAGRYSQDYLLLATDAVLAAREAKRLAGARAGRIGYQGASQGGWVAPLAARIEPVDFVIVSFGLAVSPIEEDREAIAYDIERAGYGADIEAKAMQVADATAAIVVSNFTEGFEQLDEVKKKYGAEPWFKAVRGNVSGYILDAAPDTIRKQFPALLEGMPAQYDPMPVLENLQVPQLWILGGKDKDAPPAETIRRLARLRKAGRPIAMQIFPNAEHGMYEFEIAADGERLSTRQPAGYFAKMCDFIKAKRH